MRLITKSNWAAQKPQVAKAWAYFLDFCQKNWQKIKPHLYSSWKRFILCCLVPTFVVGFYYTFLASDMYVSNAMFSIRDPQRTASIPQLSSLFGGVASSTTADSYLIGKYVYTSDIFNKIDKKLNLIDHFASSDHDFYSRLGKNSSHADLLKYWQWVLRITFDIDTGIISTEVKAYDPQMAQRINEQVIALSEDLVNEMNERAHADSMVKAREEVMLAEKRLALAHQNMRNLRESTTLMDPMAQAESLQAIVSSLELEAAKVAAELTEVRTYMREDSPRVAALQRRLEAVQTQLAQERSKLSNLSPQQNGDEANTALQSIPNLTSVVADFENAKLEEEFARQQYTTAMASLEMARVQANGKQRYLVAFQPPTLPDESLYPEGFYFTFLTFVGSVLILALLSLVVASIREHAGF